MLRIVFKNGKEQTYSIVKITRLTVFDGKYKPHNFHFFTKWVKSISLILYEKLY